MTTFVDHADQKEQRTGRHTVVHHLHDAARDRLRREGERSEHDETKVSNRRVGDQPLEVFLHRCCDCTPQNANHCQREEQRSGPHRGFGEQVQAEPKEPVGSQLQQHAGEDDRATGWGLRMRVGQPCVQREQRHLHGERNCECEEEPAAGVGGEVGTFGQLHQIERDVAQAVLRQNGGRDDADQHERRAEHRVEEELCCGVDALVVTPAADEEIHRHEDDFEEQEEEEKIEADETAHHTRLEDEHPSEVALVIVVRVDSDNDEREQQSGENDEEQRDAVDTDVPTDSPIADPRMLRDELESGVGGFERRKQPHAETGRGDAGNECNELRPLGTTVARENREYAADHRNENQRGENRESDG